MNTPPFLDRLILIRHCSTELNEQAKVIGSSDPCLSKLGLMQLEELRVWVSSRGSDAALALSSDLRRCRETADLLSNRVHASELLRERDLGDLEGLTSEQLIDWKKSRGLPLEDPSLVWDGVGEVESDEAMVERFSQALGQLDETSGREVFVVTHAGMLKSVVYHFLDIPSERPYAIKFGLGSAIVLSRQGSRFELHQLWENPHARKRNSA
ncbi:MULTISPECIES: histidine phosphatase family protein [unclassified Ruegeria]|uniref:histidine phosphatase family protein n=1 Tax=unclassified Ruegeria TaxID=2625375 RepID=UPI0014895730|nr:MULTISPECIES: histidine phosphatase family protein [unclassified Ruegeria]NOD85913.1 hypothetical protein [Ruegeria sp. HKCCD6119]